MKYSNSNRGRSSARCALAAGSGSAAVEGQQDGRAGVRLFRVRPGPVRGDDLAGGHRPQRPERRDEGAAARASRHRPGAGGREEPDAVSVPRRAV